MLFTDQSRTFDLVKNVLVSLWFLFSSIIHFMWHRSSPVGKIIRKTWVAISRGFCLRYFGYVRCWRFIAVPRTFGSCSHSSLAFLDNIKACTTTAFLRKGFPKLEHRCFSVVALIWFLSPLDPCTSTRQLVLYADYRGIFTMNQTEWLKHLSSKLTITGEKFERLIRRAL